MPWHTHPRRNGAWGLRTPVIAAFGKSSARSICAEPQCFNKTSLATATRTDPQNFGQSTINAAITINFDRPTEGSGGSSYSYTYKSVTPAALTRGGLRIGPNPSADCERGGKQPGYVVFGGQKIPVNTDSRLRSSVPVQLRG
jgi:hypothetical protein